MSVRRNLVASVATLALFAGSAAAQDVREFSFGYGQPKSTGYGFAGDLFDAHIAECSNGTMKISQSPGASSARSRPCLRSCARATSLFVRLGT